MTPKDYVQQVDEKFRGCKKQKLSRFSSEWDQFSRNINTEMRGILFSLDDKSQEAETWKFCLAYWQVRSIMLQRYFEGKALNMVRMPKLKRECAHIKELIFNPGKRMAG